MAVPASSRALAALGLRVEDAAARLGEDKRSALELLELDGASYAEIGSAVGRSEAAVAGLLVAARLALYADLRGVEAPAPGRGVDCERARPLLAARQDGELTDTATAAWLRAHSEGCESCRSTRLAMREATLAFRGAQRAHGVAVSMPPPVVPVPLRPVEPVDPPAPIPFPVPAPPPEPPSEPPPAAVGRVAPPRRGGVGTMLAAALATITAGLAVVALAGGDDSRPDARPPAAPVSAQDSGTAPVSTTDAAALERRRRAAERRRRAAAAERRRRARATPTPDPTRPAAQSAPVPAGTEGDADEDKSKPRRPARRTPSGGGGETQTQVGDPEAGAGLPSNPSPAPGTRGPSGGGVTDVCNEDSPDCESG